MDGEVVRAGFERKFLVPEGDAARLLSAVRPLLAPDPLAGPTGEYDVASLYLDTPDLAAYQRELGGKWRLRRYGEASEVFAEFKAKPEPGKVHKRRTSLSPENCAALPHVDEAGWFSKAIRKHSLHPICLISYRRHAFVGAVDGEEIRLTLDHDVRAAARESYVVPQPLSAAEGAPLTEGRILEIKFAHALPMRLCHVLGELGLLPESFSKYRAAIDKITPWPPNFAPQPPVIGEFISPPGWVRGQ